ncbi:MAG TPA: BACON domain-containing protein [Thermoanaerobaculia bacterium]
MRTRALPLLLIIIVASTTSAASKRRATSPDRCSSTVSPASLSFPSAGGHATVNVSVTGGCTWSPVASDSWISAAPAGNQVSIDVGANSAASARTGLIHVRSAVIVVTQAANSNLLQNPGFDNGLASWSEASSLGPGSASVGSNSVIVSPGPSPNAVLITSTSNDVHSGYQLSQCVNIKGGTQYEAGTRAMIPPGQSAGVINFVIFEYWVRDCPVMPSYHALMPVVANSPIGSWFDPSVAWRSDVNAQSVLIVIGAGGTDSPPFSAWFDDVYLREKN